MLVFLAFLTRVVYSNLLPPNCTRVLAYFDSSYLLTDVDSFESVNVRLSVVHFLVLGLAVFCCHHSVSTFSVTE